MFFKTNKQPTTVGRNINKKQQKSARCLISTASSSAANTFSFTVKRCDLRSWRWCFCSLLFDLKGKLLRLKLCEGICKRNKERYKNFFKIKLNERWFPLNFLSSCVHFEFWVNFRCENIRMVYKKMEKD